MNCYLSGVIGIGLLIASFSTMTISKQQRDYLQSRISSNVVDEYIRIVDERRNLYIQGLLLGFIISLVLIRNIKNTYHKISLFFSITLGTSVVYYSLFPKSGYMLDYLKTSQENKAWLQVYKTMKYRYFIGFVLGAIASIPLSYSYCSLK